MFDKVFLCIRYCIIKKLKSVIFQVKKYMFYLKKYMEESVQNL
jgi:hypothetical protein